MDRLPAYFLIFGFISTLLLGGCKNTFRNHSYKIAVGSKTSQHYQVGTQLLKPLNAKNAHFVLLDTQGAGSSNNCERLLQGQAQFALAQNDVQLKVSDTQLRTVLPIYTQLLFIIYKKELQPTSLRDLIVGRKVAIGPKKGGTATFTRRLFQEYGIRPNEYTFVYSPYQQNTLSDEIEVSISVTGFNDARIRDMILNKGGHILSLDDPNLFNQGSSVDGFCMHYPFARPFIIPKSMLRNYPTSPLLTIAIDNVLLTKASTPSHVVYDIVNQILSNKEVLIKNDPVFRFLIDQQGFEKRPLQYPLHEGTKKYLNRNKPTFFQRHAEEFGVLITLFTLTLGAFSGIWQWNRQRKKTRVEHYYAELIKIEQQIPQAKTFPPLNELSTNLKALRKEVFDLFDEEKIDADQHFQVFLQLFNEVKNDISLRRQRLLEKGQQAEEQPKEKEQKPEKQKPEQQKPEQQNKEKPKEAESKQEEPKNEEPKNEE